MEQEQAGYWLKIGTILSNRYEILQVLGEGGVSIVYLAKDLQFNTKVSIKEFFPRQSAMRAEGEDKLIVYKGKATEDFSHGMHKFIEESKILAKFEHLKCIVIVKDYFYENNTAYFVMEYIEGETVKQIVNKYGAMNEQQVLVIMRPILNSLSLVHKAGLIHRDISPDNIILREDGKGILIDFGAARSASAYMDKTVTVFYKKGYSPREQYLEQTHIKPATDIYGICATMYFMLTGIRPDDSIHRAVKDKLANVGELNKELPVNICKAIMKGMEVDPENRYPTIELFLQDINSPKKVKITKKHIGISIVSIILLLFIGIMIKGNWDSKHTDTSLESRNNMTSSTHSALPTVTRFYETPTSTATPTKVSVLYKKMPNVVGMKLNNAKKKINKKITNTKIKTKYIYSSRTKKGIVIKQSVKAGKKLRNGKVVKLLLTISKGKEPPKVTSAPTQRPIPRITPTRPTHKPKSKNTEGDGDLPW